MKKNNLFLLIITLIIFLSFSINENAYSQPKGKQIKWSFNIDKKKINPGDKFNIKIAADILDDWHFYAMTTPKEGAIPAEIKIKGSKYFKIAGKIKQSQPIIKFEELFNTNTEYFEKNAEFDIPVLSDKSAPDGQQEIIVAIYYQMCSGQFCIPPVTDEIKINIILGKGTGVVLDSADKTSTVTDTVKEIKSSTTNLTETKISPPSAGDLTDDLEKAKSGGILSFIGFAMTMGALSLLTPCVFPMIPITVSFFTKRDQKNRKKSIRDALIYCFGIIFTFVLLGFLLAIILGASGVSQFAANPWVNLFIAIIFFIFALNLFGLFEIAIPSSLLTKLNQKSSQGSGIYSLLLMGLTFTLTTFTCTVPFIGTILVAAAKGEFFWPILGMLAYATVFALPFFFLALFPMLLKSMPRSGSWMNAIKVVMGFIVLAALIKFISNADIVLGWGLLSHDLALSVWISISLLISLYLLGVFRLPHDTPLESVGVIRLLFVILFLSITFYLFSGLFGNNLGEVEAFMPPRQNKTISANYDGNRSANNTIENLKWNKNYEEALLSAKKENKNIFVDFTGFTCTNCKWMKANILSKPEIVQLLSKFILVELYTDGQGDEYLKNRKMQEDRFGTIAIPFYVIIDKNDKMIANFPGLTREIALFKSFLEKGIN